MSKQAILTYQRATELLDYAPLTGVLTWLRRPIRPEEIARDKGWNNRFAGKEAGCITPYGYRLVCVTSELFVEEKFLGHILGWLLYYGEWPRMQIDHINRVRHDNRIANLRLATVSQNMTNGKLRCNNTSGVKGVHYNKQRNNWIASLNKDGVTVFRQSYRTMEEAVAARQEVAHRVFGEYANETIIKPPGLASSEVP
jgi:hypothetical protein